MSSLWRVEEMGLYAGVGARKTVMWLWHAKLGDAGPTACSMSVSSGT